MLKTLLKNLPDSTVEKIFKSQFKVPNSALDPNFTIKIANTQEELEAAYELLHDCYVTQKLMEPHPSGLRCTLYSLLPETSTLIVKYLDKTVGTVTLIKDSRIGLPSDEKYQAENDELRAQGRRLIEVSSLAVSKDFRDTGHSVSLLLMKYLYHHALLMGGTNLVITVHPRAKCFYSALLQFKKNGEVVQYNYVNGALAIYMHMPLNSTDHWTSLASSFKSNDFKKNMVLWLINYTDQRFKFPRLKSGQILSPVLTPNLMEYFFVKKTNLLKELPPEKRQIFFEILVHYFGESEIERFKEHYTSFELREYRTAVQISAGLEVNSEFHIVNIFDLSTNGAFIETSLDPNFKIKKGDSVTLRFRIGKKSFHLKADIMWLKNYKDSNGPIGFGIKFQESQSQIKAELSQFDNFQINAA